MLLVVGDSWLIGVVRLWGARFRILWHFVSLMGILAGMLNLVIIIRCLFIIPKLWGIVYVAVLCIRYIVREGSIVEMEILVVFGFPSDGMCKGVYLYNGPCLPWTCGGNKPSEDIQRLMSSHGINGIKKVSSPLVTRIMNN